MHLQARNANEKPRPAKMFLLSVIAQHVTHVLTQEALDAFAEFLHAVHVALLHLPLHVRPGRKRRNLGVNLVVPAHIGDQILDHRKRLQRVHGNGLVQRQRVHARLARQPRPPVHFRRARATFRSFAIPPHRQVRRLMRLNRVQRVQHDHAGSERHFIIHRPAPVTVASEHPHGHIRHFFKPSAFKACCNRPLLLYRFYFSSARICFNSSGISGTGTSTSFIAAPSRVITWFFLPHVSSVLGKSMRLCAPRLSRRARAERVTASATTSICCKSRERCHPGLNSREPSTRISPARALNFSSSPSARTKSSSVRKMPTSACSISCSSPCIV